MFNNGKNCILFHYRITKPGILALKSGQQWHTMFSRGWPFNRV